MPKLLTVPMVLAVIVLAACQPLSSSGDATVAAQQDDSARRTATPVRSPVPVATPSPAGDTPAGVQMVFTQAGGHPDDVVVAALSTVQKRLDVAYYAINRPSIVKALADDQARCGCVRLLTDTTQSAGANQKAALTTLAAAHVPIKVNSHAGIMHMKVADIDQVTILEGSWNATNAASTVNDEIEVRVDSPQIAQAFSAEFDLMWTDTRRFKDWSPTAPIPVPSPGVDRF